MGQATARSKQSLPAQQDAQGAAYSMRPLNLKSPIVGAVIVVLLFCAFSTAVGTALGIANFRDVGFPDSATLLRVGELVHSGRIYPDMNRPPYLVSIYGPLTYGLLAIPFRLAEALGISPQLFVRLGITGALTLCVLLVFLISRKLYGSNSIAWLCTLFAASVLPLASWSTQIRGDFIALVFSLLSVYCLIDSIDSPRASRAAILAAVALLVKATFIAAPISSLGWLIYRRRYKDAVSWASCFALTLAGGYAIAWWREPLMLQHMAALRHPVFEYGEALVILSHAVAQPVAPFAAVSAFLIPGERTRERLFFLTFWAVAWLVAIVTIPQAGGNINYFWEPLFASAILAGPGLCELHSRANRASKLFKATLVVPILAASLLLLWHEGNYWKLCYTRLNNYQVDKAKWQAFTRDVSGKRLLSTMPDVTIHSMRPEIPDPYLNSVLELGGQWSSASVADQIQAGNFDLVVIAPGEARTHGDHYRGIDYWSEGMWSALTRTYQRTCIFDADEEIWLPRRGTDLAAGLRKIGCLGVKPARPITRSSSASGS